MVQISEYYDVEIKEILNGERKSEDMDKELKETLLKVADYTELEKQRAARSGNISFGIMFRVCAAAIVVQMIMTGDLSLIIGETVILIFGAGVYIFSSVNNGAWNGTRIKSTHKKDFIVSVICVGIFSILLCLILSKTMVLSRAIGTSICFFIVLSTVSFALLRGISYLSKKKSDELKD